MRHYGPVLMFAALTLIGGGCNNSRPTLPKVNPGPAEGRNEKDDRDNPLVKEAKPDTEGILNDLLAGKDDNDPDLGPVARKVKGYQSWSIERQSLDPDDPKAVNFTGTLKGPKGEATFTASMKKQQNGKWMIGHFSGPNPK
jgi:hypothetical protein